MLIDIAAIVERQSTCDRNHVGAVIAQDGRVISTGYNGAPSGVAHCQHIGVTPPATMASRKEPAGMGCQVAIHAEANAIAYAARHGVGIEGATIYTTLSPCFPCSQLIVSAGLVRVVYVRAYRDLSGINFLTTTSLQVERWVMQER
jgi:dCMP deaminase